MDNRRHPLVVHTDPGLDDALALIHLAGLRADLVAAGSVHGNLPAEAAAVNTLRVLELVGWDRVPVAVGATRMWNGREPAPELSGQVVHGPDGLGGRAGPPPAGTPVRESAAEQLVRLARDRPGELTVLELGPLTNLALALDLEPRLPRLLRRVVWMGGSFTEHGNVTPFADANAFHDPEAAEHVLAAGFPLTLVPVDATAGAWADAGWVAAVEAASTPPARRVADWMGHYVDAQTEEHGRRGCRLDDVVAAAIALDPGLALVTQELEVTCETAGHCRGRLLTDRRPVRFGVALPPRPPVEVVLEARTDEVLRRLLRTLTGGPGGSPP
ncbi:purine nucleosidase [Saccharothrix tamanrassetensis]|uniref:Purine nucleosidase n=1 Tax=Saccharothrix tamanrassetensis TaxID=1051531 RepID=A0A841CRG8_9PSEU|nr:nucleoside hydrolase [Saccharothrix tamanrassetensis]MBB5958738.1 purine nucleosidase [Saccharothrix tamanrassetensis]